jgi:dTDP-4-amino-4,6-dideoxygalactose transaminase
VRTHDREGMIKHLKEAGIATGIHYPIPLHMQKAYDYLNYRQGDFPISEKVASEIVSLPMYPNLQPEQQARVVQEMLRLLRVEMVR